MHTTLGKTQRAALTLGAVTALTIVGAAAPAQAKGNEDNRGSDNRSTSLKSGKGHNDSWQAQADPDGDENGGVDQPGGSGGVNTDDQDGNNGSGNDSDCEDDNRGKGVPGHCKDKPGKDKPGKGQPSQPGEPGEPGTDEPSTDEPGYPGTSDEDDEDAPEQGESDGTDADEDADEDADDGTDTGSSTGPGTRPEAAPTTRPVVLGIERQASPSRGADVNRAATTAATTATTATTPAADTTGVLPNTGNNAALALMLAGGLGATAAGTVLLRRRRVTA